MVSLNKVFLMGNLTRDPELRYSGGGGGGSGGGGGGGSAICKFGLAVNRQWRDQGGQPQEEVTFVDLTVFGRQAETCNEYLRKGRPVFVEGRLQFSQWEDRESGQKRSKLEVVAERVQFLGGPQRDGEGGAPAGASGSSRGRHESAAPAPHASNPQPGGASPTGAPKPAARGGEGVDFDDIPF